MSRLPNWFDSWLTNNPDEQPDPPECRRCHEPMEWIDDADESGPCGSWECINEDCPEE